jgi:ComF family protein
MNANALVKVIRTHSFSYVTSLINLFFPHCCTICGTPLVHGEEFLCMRCNMNLPRTHFHLLPDNPVERLFWGKMNLERATSFIYYHRGSDSSKIIHQLKYGGRKEIGEVMGRYMATEILPSGFFDGIDVLIPVPLHPKRLRDRGYNQSEWIAKGIANVTKLPIETQVIKRKKHIETQTHKTPFERWENVHQIFALQQPERIEGKHVLLIDDVLTTGATILACASTFSEIKDLKISVLTIAVAGQ